MTTATKSTFQEIEVNKVIKLANDSLYINPDVFNKRLRKKFPFSPEFLAQPKAKQDAFLKSIGYMKSEDIAPELRAVRSVYVTKIEMAFGVEEEEGFVIVKHDGPAEIYSDTGFAKAIAELVGFKVEFSEFAMQSDGVAVFDNQGL